jgi:hypothetical protein
MKFIKTFSQPLLLALVWLMGFRPVTAIVEKIDPQTAIPPTVLGTMDIALISSGVAFLFSLWKQPIEISTKLTNISTRRSNSSVEIKEGATTTFKIWLEITIKVKNSDWINWSKVAQLFGGIYVGIKENCLISHEIDSRNGSSIVKDVDQQPFIHIFDKFSELSEASELEYELHFFPDKTEAKTAEIISNIKPIHKKIFLRFITKLFILIYIKQKHEKHPVYFNFNKKG